MKYAAFFRGINVGGINKVKMDDLRTIFVNLGFSSVKTYIQSGNIVFITEKEVTQLTEIIENALLGQFGFVIPVILRTTDEIKQIISAMPFDEDKLKMANEVNPKAEYIYIFMSNSKINLSVLDYLKQTDSGQDEFYVSNKEIFLFCFDSIPNSKYASLLMRKDLMLTSRNQKTMLKINELLNEN